MDKEKLMNEIVALYKKTAIVISEDILDALRKGKENEKEDLPRELLSDILKNIDEAKNLSKPICQDTGTPFFYVKCPKDYSQKELTEIILKATDIATKNVPLRPNAVDSISGKNIGNFPIIHFEESDKFNISLLLKGGGSENVSSLYSLPNKELNASRNLEGVRKCVLDTIYKAQGKGCPPYIIGVAIGGNIEQVAHISKKLLLKDIRQENDDNTLNAFEKRLLDEINSLEIGPLGLDGKTTALSVKIESAPRHPASFFVGISINCWCVRRGSI